MRIAVLTQGYNTAGGVQTVARWLKSGLLANGHVAEVFNLANSRSDPASQRLLDPRTWFCRARIRRDPIESDVLHVGSYCAELEFVRYLPRKQLTQALADFDAILVVAGAGTLAYAAVRSGRPIVLQLATTLAEERRSRMWADGMFVGVWRTVMTSLSQVLERRALQFADAVMVENHHMQAVLTRGYERHAKAVILAPPASTDLDTVTSRARPWNASGYILCFGRLNEPRKGLTRILDAYALLVAARPAPALILAGRGHLPAALMERIRRLGIEGRVQVRPDVAQEDLPSLFGGASMFWQASYEEGLGIAVIEAMSAGLPAIVTDTAGTRMSIRHEIDGYLISQDCDVPRAFVDAAQSILNGRGEDMSVRARARVEEAFDSDKLLLPYLLTLEELVAR